MASNRKKTKGRKFMMVPEYEIRKTLFGDIKVKTGKMKRIDLAAGIRPPKQDQ